MKRLTLALVGLGAMLFALPAKAEIGLGVKAGINTSSLKTEIDNAPNNFKNYATDFKSGFFIGPTADWKSDVIGIGADASLLFSKRGADDFEQKGLEIPINMRLYVFDVDNVLGIFVAAGPNFFFNFKDDYEHFKKKTTDVSLNLGIGAKMVKHVDLGINYLIPLGNSFEYKGIANKVLEGDMKMRTWQFSIAITI